jgi:hypothetical protein
MSKRAVVLPSLPAFDRVDAAAEADCAASRLSAAVSRALTTHLVAIVVLCVAAYALIEVLYVLRLPLIADEFDGASDVYALRNQLPYADFAPYKTVLGYYLELPPLLMARTVWSGLIGEKLLLTALNAGATVAAAMLAVRRFSARAVVLALPMWLCMSDWLERSSELRVDALTSWAGLFALFALLASRPALAGLIAGVALLVSQKGLYFCLSSIAGLVALGLVGKRPRECIHALRRFGTAYALTVLFYVAFWSMLSSWQVTTHATFFAHRAIVFDNLYQHIRRFWPQSMKRNPVFYAATIVSLVTLVAHVLGETRRKTSAEPARARDAILCGYAVLFTACVVWHKQPWPYFFVFVVPTAFVVQVWAIEFAWRAHDRFVHRPTAPWMLSRPWIAGRPLIALTSLCALGAVYSAQRAGAIFRLDNDYQHHMLTLASVLVAPDEYYLATTDMLYTRTQSSSLLRRVSYPRRRELAEDAENATRTILNDFLERPPKILIRNDRFSSFPSKVRKYLRDHYAPLWGSIDLYAPVVRAADARLDLQFGGDYRWTSADHRPARIGVLTVEDGGTVKLERGPLRIRSSSEGRLSLRAPAIEALADPRFRQQRDFFGDVYGR